MHLTRHNIVSTKSVEEAVEGIRARSCQFIRVDSRPDADWHYEFNRVEIGTARLAVSSARHIKYEQVFSPDIVITGVFAGVECMKVGGVVRESGHLASFAPISAATGEIRSGKYWTVRLSVDKLSLYLSEMHFNEDPAVFVSRYWYKALPGSGRFNRFVSYLLHHIDDCGAPTSLEAVAFEDLLYLNAARLMLTDSDREFRFSEGRNIELCAQYIDENLHTEVTSIELARVSGMSVRSLQYLFKKHTGSGIRNFVVERKLQRARELIAHGRGDETIQAVSLSVGFESSSYFARLYKAMFGELPSATLQSVRSRRDV
jgi:AraC-like DNA-binding protein